MSVPSPPGPEGGGRGVSRALMAAFGVALFLTFASFDQRNPGWNVTSRLALTMAIVDYGQLNIDPYQAGGQHEMETGDRALFEGHYYSDKSIGTSLLGVLVLAALRGVEVVASWDVSPMVEKYVLTTVVCGGSAAVAGVLLLWLLSRLSVRWSGDGRAVPGVLLLAAWAVCTATPMLYYSSLFMAYAPATMFLLLSWAMFERGAGGAGRGVPWFACGLAAGLCVLCEFLYGAAAGMLLVYMMWTWRPGAGALGRLAAGGLLGLLPFAVYSWVIFGALTIPYQHHDNEMFREAMSKGFMGATAPRLVVLYLISLHPYRGLFFHSPFLLLAALGLCAMLSRGATRPVAVLCLGVTAFTFLFNSAYYMWWGGYSFSARHLIPAIPFLAAGLVPWVERAWGWLAIAAAAVPAVFIHWVVNAFDPQIRDNNSFTPLGMLLNPSWQSEFVWLFPRHIWPAVRLGEGHTVPGSMLGLTGAGALLPIIAIWALFTAVAWYIIGRQRARQLPNP